MAGSSRYSGKPVFEFHFLDGDCRSILALLSSLCLRSVARRSDLARNDSRGRWTRRRRAGAKAQLTWSHRDFPRRAVRPCFTVDLRRIFDFVGRVVRFASDAMVVVFKTAAVVGGNSGSRYTAAVFILLRRAELAEHG